MDWFDAVLVLMSFGVAALGFLMIKFLGSDYAARSVWPSVWPRPTERYPPTLRWIHVLVTVTVSLLLLISPFFRLR